MEYHNGLRNKPTEDEDDFDWDPAQAEIDHEEALLVEEKAARSVSKAALHFLSLPSSRSTGAVHSNFQFLLFGSSWWASGV